MAKLGGDTHVLLDGAVKVYKRGNSKRWQATFQIDGHWVRISTGKRADAKSIRARRSLRETFGKLDLEYLEADDHVSESEILADEERFAGPSRDQYSCGELPALLLTFPEKSRRAAPFSDFLISL